MHVMAYVSKDGLDFWERRFGSLKKDDCRDIVRRVLRRVSETIGISRVLLVVGNAPCHHGLESVFEESEFSC